MEGQFLLDPCTKAKKATFRAAFFVFIGRN